MTEREALFRIEALLEAGSYDTTDGDVMLKGRTFGNILETINIALAQGEENEN